MVRWLRDDDVQLLPSAQRRYLASARGRVVHLGLIFFLLFGAYLMMQAFAVTLYGEQLASNMLVALYATFTIACLAAPAVTNTLGPKPTLGLGVLSYVPIPVSSLLLATWQQEWCRVLVVIAGAISGAGGACMWTAQGRLMLEAASISGDPAKSFGIFWAFFSTAAVAGGLLTFGFYSSVEGTGHAGEGIGKEPSEPPIGLFYVYTLLMLAAASLTLCVSQGGASSTSPGSAVTQTIPGASWQEEARHTLAMIGEPRIVLLAPLFFYSGFNQPYQLDTFGNRFFSPRLLGLELVAFYSLGAIGGVVAGQMLDGHFSAGSPRNAARRTLALFLAANLVAAVIAAWHEARAGTGEASALGLKMGSAESLPATFAFSLWGFADAQVQGYVYWLLPRFFEGGAPQAHAVGLFKMVQAFGWMIGFVLVPADRVPPGLQLALTVACCIFSTALALTSKALPPQLLHRNQV